MEKHIMRWAYWLGLIAALLAGVTRVLNMAGLVSTTLLQTKGNSISYRSLEDAAFLFLAVAIATASLGWFRQQER
jgi:hypothetical protein